MGEGGHSERRTKASGEDIDRNDLVSRLTLRRTECHCAATVTLCSEIAVWRLETPQCRSKETGPRARLSSPLTSLEPRAYFC